MDLKDKHVLILGGSGLVGRAVARRLLDFGPRTIALVARYEAEVASAAEELRAGAGDAAIETAWGDIFMPAEVAQLDRATMLASAKLRQRVLDDLLGELSAEILERSFLFQLLKRLRPDAVVDCVNTATAFAYQDVFRSAQDLLATMRQGSVTREAVEEHVLSIPMPRLIRHVQIIREGLREVGTQAYVKIGTSGSGGMGLNVPYTHSEERPSRMLLTKSAVAGAHSMLLFLLGRTPDAPATIEIKPTAVIAWREIGYGPIRRGGQPIRKVDCPKPLELATAFKADASGWSDTGSALESVFADTGENGLFAREEFETVTALGQMEFITPEEIADYVVMELRGRPTGRDIVAALDAATAGPTYRAGVLRAAAIERLVALEQEHGVRSVAFEMLGPPRLTKLLYEAWLLSVLRRSVRDLAESGAEALSASAAQRVAQDAELRSIIVSVGLPIIIPGGKVYRGERVIVPPVDGDIARAVQRGWVDVRSENCETWIHRAQRVIQQVPERVHGSGSNFEWGAMGPDDVIAPAQLVTWIFRFEDGGVRTKR